MRQCDKRDITWLTALMLDADIFGACSEDGTEKKKMAGYIRAMMARPDIVIVSPAPLKMVHTFQRHSGVMWEIHTAIKRNSGLSGREKINLTRDTCKWMIRTKGARKFITHVPAGNRAAGIYAVACGLTRVGIITSAIQKGGELIDMALYQSVDEDIKNARGEI